MPFVDGWMKKTLILYRASNYYLISVAQILYLYMPLDIWMIEMVMWLNPVSRNDILYLCYSNISLFPLGYVKRTSIFCSREMLTSMQGLI